MQFYSLAAVLPPMLNHPVEALHPVFIDIDKLIFQEWCDQYTYGKNQSIWRAVWCSRHSFREHSKEEVTRRWICVVSWGRDSTDFCCSQSCLTFSAVMRSCIAQMDHNAWKCFLPTLPTDVFHQLRNNRFDKEGHIILHGIPWASGPILFATFSIWD
jgi:hypothetical protein